jgi:hypothetical protein
MATPSTPRRHPAWRPLLEGLAALEVSWPGAFTRVCNSVALYLDLSAGPAGSAPGKARRRLVHALRAAAPEGPFPSPPVCWDAPRRRPTQGATRRRAAVISPAGRVAHRERDATSR